jgi:hypothetical protein
MSYEILFPKDKDQKEEAISRMVQAGKDSRHVTEINWWIAHYYLQGARDFRNVNYQEGTLDITYTNSDGVLDFRYDEIVSKYQAQIGRLLQIDLTPSVSKRSIGLEDLQRASIAQIVLQSVITPAKVLQLKQEALGPLLKYGCIGLVVWQEDEFMGVEVVMPWELVPLPANPIEIRDLRGVARCRKVPLDWIKQLGVTPSKESKVYKEMVTTSMPVGQIPLTANETFTTFTGTGVGAKNTPFTGAKKKDETQVDIVEFIETWTKTSQGYLAEYNMMAGGKLIYTKDYTDKYTPMPITIANDMQTGGFWGRSFISLQIPLNSEIEYSLGALFQNIQDLDTYGIMLMPTTLGIDTEIMKGRDGLKRIAYEPDYTAPDLRPTNIVPVNSGKLPIDLIKIGSGLSDKIANQPTELMKGDAPGRVDSQAGLGFLYEVSNTALNPTATSLAIAVVGCYEAILSIAQMTWPQSKVVEVSTLDDTLAGIKLDAQAGTISLASNAIPSPNLVNISVKAMLPKSKEQEKMEMLTALKEGIIDMFEYRTQARIRGLEIPVGNEAEWQNYRRAILENILLFGDGQKSGEVIFDEDDIHEVHLRVLQTFRSRPEYYLASVEVKENFKKHYLNHMEGIGALPDNAPYAEEAAEEEQMNQQMMAQGNTQLM